MVSPWIAGKEVPTARLRSSVTSTTRALPDYERLQSKEVELSSDHNPLTIRHHGVRDAQADSILIKPYHTQTPQQGSYSSQLWYDIKNVPWRWLGRRLLSHVLPPIAALLSLVLLVLMSVRPWYFTRGLDRRGAVNLCQPDGSFKLSFERYTPWRGDSAFTIDIKFGSYSFGAAKLIDVFWDVGVGRGGQGLLAIVSYRVFTKGLTRLMETSSVSYDTFKAITLQNDTVAGVTALAKRSLRSGDYRAKAQMLWTIIASLFILLVPTWLSAMTGYTADIKPFVQDKNGKLVPAEIFEPVIYTIHDGARFRDGWTNDTHIAVPWLDGVVFDEVAKYGFYQCLYPNLVRDITDDGRLVFYDEALLECKWMWAVSKYVSEYGFLGNATATNTTFQRPDESNSTTPVDFTPSLNISAHFAFPEIVSSWRDYPDAVDQEPSWRSIPYGRAWQDPVTHERIFNVSNPGFLESSSLTFYSLTALNNAGSCQQDGSVVKYQWGFSFILLFSFIFTFLVWMVVTWSLYLNTWLHSRLDVAERQIGFERAVLDLSQSMQSTVDADSVKMSSNAELYTLVRNRQLTYIDLPADQIIATRSIQFAGWRQHFNMRRWVDNEKWWLSALLVFTIMVILSWTTPVRSGYHPWPALLPGFGVFLVLAAGSTTRSRWLLFAGCLLLFLPLNFTWTYIARSVRWLDLRWTGQRTLLSKFV